MSLFHVVLSPSKAPSHHYVFRFVSERHLIFLLIIVFVCSLSSIGLEVQKMIFITVRSSFSIEQVSLNTR